MKCRSFLSLLAVTTIASCTHSLPDGKATRTDLPQRPSPPRTLSLPTRVAPTSPSGTSLPDGNCPLSSLFPSSTADSPVATPPSPQATLSAGTPLHLVEWTPSTANTLIQALALYPEVLTYSQRGYHDSGYYYSFIYSRLAEEEAMLRFPDSPWVEAWAWDRAYRLALQGANGVTEAYAGVVDHALNVLHVPISQLASWMNRCDPRTEVSLRPVARGSTSREGYLVEISDPMRGAGSYVWITGVGSSFEAYPLESAWDFGYSSAAGIDFELADATGDGSPEAFISHFHYPGSMDSWVTDFDVIDISDAPPRELMFEPPLPRGYTRTWSVITPDLGGPGLRFDFTFDTAICSFTWTRVYIWQADRFALVDEVFPEPESIIEQVGRAREDGFECVDYLFMVLLDRLRDGAAYLDKDVQRLVSEWPYSQSMVPPNEDNAADERDRARFLLGLYLALSGDVEGTRLQMTTIAEAPTTDTSRWIAPARAMLASLHNAEDLLDACAAAQACYPYFQIGELSRYLHVARDADPVATLRRAGYPIVDSMQLDANADSRTDVFLVQRSRDPEASEPSWLLLASEEGYEAFEISYPAGSTGIAATSSFSYFPTFATFTPEGRVLYAVVEDPTGGHLEVERLCALVEQQLEGLQIDLLRSADATRVRTGMLEIDEWTQAACATEPWTLDRFLPRHLYFLGLASELAGDPEGALDFYTRLWGRYPASAYAILAAAKLEPVP